MVWGMPLPSSFGEFWPDGDFEGWQHRLETYYKQEMPESDKALYEDGQGNGVLRYASTAMGKFTSEVGTRDNAEAPVFTPIEAHEPPSIFVTLKTCKSLGSLVALNFGLLAVDEALKAIVERMEPGLHTFFPVEIRMPKGETYPTKYYVMVVGRFLDSFLPEKSGAGAFKEPLPGYYILDRSKKGMSGLVLSKAARGDAQLWRERSGRVWLTFLSDELEAEIEREGLKIPPHYRVKEV